MKKQLDQEGYVLGECDQTSVTGAEDLVQKRSPGSL